MDLICTLCKNKNPFQYYVFHQESLCKNEQNKSHRNHKPPYSHLICSLFFPEVYCEYSPSSIWEESHLKEAIKNYLFKELVLCGTNNLKETVMDDCSICKKSINGYFLLSCIVKGCKNYFHFHCTEKREDIRRVKLMKSDKSSFKYGFLCSKHSIEFQSNHNIFLKTKDFSIEKKLQENNLLMYLSQFEKVIFEAQVYLESMVNISQKGSCLKELLLSEKPEEILQKNTFFPDGEDKPVFEYDTFGDFYTVSSDEEFHISQNKKIVDADYPSQRSIIQSKARGNFENIDPNKKNKDSNFNLKKRNDSKMSLENQTYLLNILTLNQSEPSNEQKQQSNSLESTQCTQNSPKEDRNIEEDQSLSLLDNQKSEENPVEFSQPVQKSRKSILVGSYNLRKIDFSKIKQKFNQRRRRSRGLGGERKISSNQQKNTLKQEKESVSEDVKRSFWIELEKSYYRNIRAKEMAALKLLNIMNVDDILRSEINKIYHPLSEDKKQNYFPLFSVEELKSSKSSVNNDLKSLQSMKVLFDYSSFYSFPTNSESIWKNFQGYLATFSLCAKEKRQITQEKWNQNQEKAQNQNFIFSQKSLEIYKLFNPSFEKACLHSSLKLPEELQDELDFGKLYKLLKLTDLETLGFYQLQDIKAQHLFQNKLNEIKTTEKNSDNIDEITKEIMYLNFFLQQFIYPEENKGKEALLKIINQQDKGNYQEVSLKEKADELNSELKLIIIKNHFFLGFQDKTEASVKQLDGWIEEEYGPYSFSYKTSLQSQKCLSRKNSSFERNLDNADDTHIYDTDCCICFHSDSNDNNPIIYCSKCDGSFHKYCYGVLEDVSNQDFYCDVCLKEDIGHKHHDVSGFRFRIKKKLLQNLKMEDKIMVIEPIRSEALQCELCGVSSFPLKKFSNNWYHVNCLLLHDLVSYNRGEFALKRDKLEQSLLQAKNCSYVCGICGFANGLFAKCMGRRCGKVYHILCAYLEGYQICLKEILDDKLKSTKKGFLVDLFCPRHCADKKRNAEEQKYLRRYALNFQNTLQFKTFESYLEVFNPFTKSMSKNLSKNPICIPELHVPPLISENKKKQFTHVCFGEDEEFCSEARKQVKLS